MSMLSSSEIEYDLCKSYRIQWAAIEKELVIQIERIYSKERKVWTFYLNGFPKHLL